jgi:hypothetical protein
MKIFISWSGPTSRAIALALRDWLPVMFGGITAFVSSEDIDKGARWATELDNELDQTDFGILCLTPDNLEAPWILYEAGALAKSVARGRCACVLHGVSKSSLAYPLARFQATDLVESDLLLLTKAINKELGESSQAEPQLELRFEALWSMLEKALTHATLTKPDVTPSPERSDRQLLEEVLAAVRVLADTVDSAVPQGVEAGVVEEIGTEVPVIRPRWSGDTSSPMLSGE